MIVSNGLMASRGDSLGGSSEVIPHRYGSVDSLSALRCKRCQLSKAKLVEKFQECMGQTPPSPPKPRTEKLDLSKFPWPAQKQRRSTVSSPLRHYVETASLVQRLAAEPDESGASSH
jgi:hypothetical protein